MVTLESKPESVLIDLPALDRIFLVQRCGGSREAVGRGGAQARAQPAVRVAKEQDASPHLQFMLTCPLHPTPPMLPSGCTERRLGSCPCSSCPHLPTPTKACCSGGCCTQQEGHAA